MHSSLSLNALFQEIEEKYDGNDITSENQILIPNDGACENVDILGVSIDLVPKD